MITLHKMLRAARSGWRLAQARLLIAQVNRRNAQRERLRANPGYDELRSPAFISVMLAAVIVLAIDITDAWPRVIALLLTMSAGA